LARHESRGGHYRSDFAGTDATGTRTFMTLADAERITAEAVPGPVTPACAAK
jgi:L-aspartate oxidase